MACPFQFFLSRRLGLSNPLYYSKALSRGSWAHTIFELLDHYHNPSTFSELLEKRVQSRYLELNATRLAYSISTDTFSSFMEQDRRDRLCAEAWLRCLLDFPIKDTPSTIFSYLTSPKFKLLATELYMSAPVILSSGRVQGTIQVDRLCYSPDQKLIWIIDLKSTAKPPSLRAESCPLEFQTLHYLHTVHQLLDCGFLQAHFSLPPDTRLGGMIHVITQKPTIEFCSKDRNYTEVPRTLKSGPRKGQTVVERDYEGEPVFENYVKRCLEWFRGEGAHTDRQSEAREFPPVVLSFTSWAGLESRCLSEYNQRVSQLLPYYLCEAEPHNFPRRPESHSNYSELSPYWPFYVKPLEVWPEIMIRNRLVPISREAGLPVDTAKFIKPASEVVRS